MKSIGIIADSHSSISQSTAKTLGITVLPAPFYIDGNCYYEDVTLTREQFFEKLESFELLSPDKMRLSSRGDTNTIGNAGEKLPSFVKSMNQIQIFQWRIIER